MIQEKRKHPRVPIKNPISYICIDDDGNQIDAGMGTTVDISQGGTLIETAKAIESNYILLISIDLDENIIETKGRVAHTRSVGSAKYLTGVQFLAPPQEVIRIVKNLIHDYHSRRDEIISN
jgi:c-di-GMP-binding flagellar brake protein YcgR